MLLTDKNFTVQSLTLGGKQKAFNWKIDEYNNIIILKYIGIEFPILQKYIVTSNELDKIDSYLFDHEWSPLSNSVSKLNDGTEKDGLGKFLYDITKDVSKAQCVSQISSIFTLSGSWIKNEKNRGMCFKRNSENWKECVLHYYIKLLNKNPL